MSQKLPHLYLKNPSGLAKKFNKSRNVTKTTTDDNVPQAYHKHKERLDFSFKKLHQDKRKRLEQRTLDIEQIEIIEVRFMVPFSDGVKFKIRSRFINDFGLSPVVQKDFNRTVLFAIVDYEKFGVFDTLLNRYISSSDEVLPRLTDYAIMTTIYDIKFHSADDIRNHCSGDLVFELINMTEDIHADYEGQLGALKVQLKALKRSELISDYIFDPYEKILQIKNANADQIKFLAENFDILAQAHTLRSKVVRPDQYNNIETAWDLTVKPSPKSTTVIGVIDNGIRVITPLKDIVLPDGIDITRTNDALSAAHRHGTVVASLAAIGQQFFTEENNLVADASIFSIKVLENMNGYIDAIAVYYAIRKAADSGIRIFNLSICAQGKAYNQAPSFFAYLLDKLAYELDVLIFIAAGNLDFKDIKEMQQNTDPLHDYPLHFYNPGHETDYHNCEATNICSPAESMNHMTVGALADNCREDTQTDLSLDKNLAAYYSRKNHYDSSQIVNGGKLSPYHWNKNFFKPDISMPGGDLLNEDSAMQVLGFGDRGDDFFVFDSGTSLAAPLASNLAAKLLNIYPELSVQSVKALLINSAKSYPSKYLKEQIDKRKDSLSLNQHGNKFVQLTKPQKSNITRQVLSANVLHRNLCGYGRPNLDKLLYSSPNSVTFIVEDNIPTDHHKVILLNVPEYLLESEGKSALLELGATLCFKINPAWGNHVDYNPLHISFNFANSVVKDSVDELTAILADKDHEYYKENHWTQEIRDLEHKKARRMISDYEKEKLSGLKTKMKSTALGIKKDLESWSEDFFPLVNKPLSNRQQLSISMKKEDIKKIGNQIAIVMRCAIKENLEHDLLNWAEKTKNHPFSLILQVEDKSKIKGTSLYDELQACNGTEVVLNNLEDADQDLEAEA